MNRIAKMSMISFLAAASILTANTVIADINRDLPNIYPTFDLSAVRYIYCHDPKDKTGKWGWTGTGTIIGNRIILTALHVANGEKCMDLETGNSLKLYKSDPAHDLALMTGKTPKVPYAVYSCEPYKKKQTYIIYGISDYMRADPLFRMNVVVAGKEQDQVLGDGKVEKAITGFYGATVPGMSGGPVIDLKGTIHGVLNIGGHDDFSFPTKYSGSYQLADSKMLCPK